MSKAYSQAFGNDLVTKEELREFLKPKFRKQGDGRPVYITEQSHKSKCDIKNIIKKYNKTGLVDHVSNMEFKYGNMSGMDFKTMQDTIAQFNSSFQELPSSIRKRFENSPEKLLEFFENPGNREEAERLGLVSNMWTEETDGLGEHIKNKAERKTKPAPVTEKEAGPEPTE